MLLMNKIKREYSNKDIKQLLDSMIILIDSREKKISHLLMYFKHKKIKYEIYKLDYGDYSFMIPKNESLDILEDIYFNDKIAIERKANAEEISNNFAKGRERFHKEFERSSGNLRLLIEDSTYSDISNGEYNTKFPKESFIGSLHSFQEKYDCPFFFIDKQHSGEYICTSFKYYLKNNINNKLKEIH